MQRSKRHSAVSTCFLAFGLALLSSGCGANLFATGEAKDPPEDAALALERGDANEAIDILEAALASDGENPQLLSLLSAAYAQRAGVEPLSLAQGMGSQSDGGGDDGSGDANPSNDSLVSLFGIMPEATASSVADIDTAVSLLASVPSAQWMPGDPFKIAIYQTASMVMHLKILDTNRDGELSIEEILDLSDASAGGLINQLAAAQSTLAGQGADSETMQQAASTLAKYQTQIDSAEGATAEERLRNYIAASQSTP